MKSVANDYKKKDVKSSENLDTLEANILDETLINLDSENVESVLDENETKLETEETEVDKKEQDPEINVELTEDISNQTIDNAFLENLMNNIPVIQSDSSKLSKRKKKLISTLSRRKTNKPIKVIDTNTADADDTKYNRKKK